LVSLADGILYRFAWLIERRVQKNTPHSAGKSLELAEKNVGFSLEQQDFVSSLPANVSRARKIIRFLAHLRMAGADGPVAKDEKRSGLSALSANDHTLLD